MWTPGAVGHAPPCPRATPWLQLLSRGRGRRPTRAPVPRTPWLHTLSRRPCHVAAAKQRKKKLPLLAKVLSAQPARTLYVSNQVRVWIYRRPLSGGLLLRPDLHPTTEPGGCSRYYHPLTGRIGFVVSRRSPPGAKAVSVAVGVVGIKGRVRDLRDVSLSRWLRGWGEFDRVGVVG